MSTAPTEPKKQNILPAISDDLMDRVIALQLLYQIDDKPMPFEFLLDQSLTAYIKMRAIGKGTND